MKTTIGGDRLGSGNKQTISLRNYERSPHDLSYIWRSSMSAGTLVPFMSEVALPGDTFDINLNCEVLTLPTVGPLFGSYKVQLDVFECPVRLYNGKLHMNMLNIGLDMSQIKLPQIEIEALTNYENIVGDNSQINPSCLLSYLNIRGLGQSMDGAQNYIKRSFNALSYLAYWDIYKQYYSNKQEGRGFAIHNPVNNNNQFEVLGGKVYNSSSFIIPIGDLTSGWVGNPYEYDEIYFVVQLRKQEGLPNLNQIVIEINGLANEGKMLFENVYYDEYTNRIVLTEWKGGSEPATYTIEQGQMIDNTSPFEIGLRLEEFPLENIDQMRKDILADVNSNSAFIIDKRSLAPYNFPLVKSNYSDNAYSKLSSQEALGIKTYQSDIFNNWISTEWIDGDNGVNAVTAVATNTGSFTIDALNLASKVYNMLNRIAISGGTYDDWLDAVYTHERARSQENPIYHGSLIKEMGFEEVVSTTESMTPNGNKPLGTLAGRGSLTNKHKGGNMVIRVNEPSYIIGIVSLTPRVDYSQGNKWDVNLKTMNDFHKPALDEIGFQDLITDQMAWFDTKVDPNSENILFRSAGKVPAWINYMTNVNQTRGNFADKDKEMFMTLNRRYDASDDGIVDLTTYIDPVKFNYLFAQASLDSQNFWVQISNDITARRKMSAKVIPNL